MKKRFLTLLLALALLCSLTLPAAALQTQPVEVGSALELAQAMAAPASPRRGLFRARTAAAAEPTRVIALSPLTRPYRSLICFKSRMPTSNNASGGAPTSACYAASHSRASRER